MLFRIKKKKSDQSNDKVLVLFAYSLATRKIALSGFWWTLKNLTSAGHVNLLQFPCLETWKIDQNLEEQSNAVLFGLHRWPVLAIGSPSGSDVHVNNGLPARWMFSHQEKSEGTKQTPKLLRMVLRERCAFTTAVCCRKFSSSKLLHRHMRTHARTRSFLNAWFPILPKSDAYCRENNKSLNRSSAWARSRVMEIIREDYCAVFIHSSAWVLCVPTRKCLCVRQCKTSFRMSCRCGPWSC